MSAAVEHALAELEAREQQAREQQAEREARYRAAVLRLAAGQAVPPADLAKLLAALERSGEQLRADVSKVEAFRADQRLGGEAEERAQLEAEAEAKAKAKLEELERETKRLRAELLEAEAKATEAKLASFASRQAASRIERAHGDGPLFRAFKAAAASASAARRDARHHRAAHRSDSDGALARTWLWGGPAPAERQLAVEEQALQQLEARLGRDYPNHMRLVEQRKRVATWREAVELVNDPEERERRALELDSQAEAAELEAEELRSRLLAELPPGLI
ncbi:MAG: hypothetical protein AB7N76_19025 [Planctomycetota bacterium]